MLKVCCKLRLLTGRKKINRLHLTQIRVVETDHKVYEGRQPHRLVSLNQTRRHRSLKTLV